SAGGGAATPDRRRREVVGASAGLGDRGRRGGARARAARRRGLQCDSGARQRGAGGRGGGAGARGPAVPAVEAFKAIPGHGIEARVEGRQVLVGNLKLMRDRKVGLGELEARASQLADAGKNTLYVRLVWN